MLCSIHQGSLMYVCKCFLLACLLLCWHRPGKASMQKDIICACWMPCHAMLCPWIADANRHDRQCHASMPCVLCAFMSFACMRASSPSGVQIRHPTACHASLCCFLHRMRCRGMVWACAPAACMQHQKAGGCTGCTPAPPAIAPAL